MKFQVPLPLKIGALVIGTTALYTYIGQLVPQKTVMPPQETVMSADMTTADLVRVGSEIAGGKGLCLTCHTLGKSGALRFPDLQGIATTAVRAIVDWAFAELNLIRIFACVFSPNPGSCTSRFSLQAYSSSPRLLICRWS